jgi:hypothetical protein
VKVDLGYNTAVKGVAIQGQDGSDNFVTAFYVSYSEDLSTWTDYREPSDPTTTVYL